VDADGFAAVQRLLEGRHRVARVYRVWLQGVGGKVQGWAGKERWLWAVRVCVRVRRACVSAWWW
jgi:hypothetical protein